MKKLEWERKKGIYIDKERQDKQKKQVLKREGRVSSIIRIY